MSREDFLKGAKNALKNSDWTAAAASRIRGGLQEAKAHRNLRHAQHVVAKRNSGLPVERSQVGTYLRERKRSRGSLSTPKQVGELHIFLLYAKETWTSILPTSLRPFGEVSEFDYLGAGFRYSTADAWPATRRGLNDATRTAFASAQQRRRVDVVVGYTSGFATEPSVLSEMASTGAVILNFCWDDKLNWPGERVDGVFESPAGIASQVDLNLTNAPESLVRYAAHDGLAMFWPEAAHPEVHRPHSTEFEFDVSFVGARYGWRPAFIDQLRAKGIRIECFGRGWPNGTLSDSEMVRLYSRSRINLGFAGIGHSKKLMCLKGRDFEVPMSGGLYLTQANPELALVYELGTEIVTYENASDCAARIRELLEDPPRAAAIRAAGRARALRDHTYEARWSEAFATAGVLQIEGRSPR